MSRQIMIPLAVTALLSAAFISSDASARVYRGAGVRAVGAAAAGAYGYGSCRVWQCGPYGACGWVYRC